MFISRSRYDPLPVTVTSEVSRRRILSHRRRLPSLQPAEPHRRHINFCHSTISPNLLITDSSTDHQTHQTPVRDHQFDHCAIISRSHSVVGITAIMESLTTHPSTAQQAKAFTAAGSLSYPGGHGHITPPSSDKDGNHTDGKMVGVEQSGNGVAPNTPAATPGAPVGKSGLLPTLQ